MARSTHSRFSSLNPLRFSSLVRTSVSNRLRVLAPAACFSSARRPTTACIAGSWANRSASLVSSYPAKRL